MTSGVPGSQHQQQQPLAAVNTANAKKARSPNAQQLQQHWQQHAVALQVKGGGYSVNCGSSSQLLP
jgi:hypothetical protein